MIEKLGQIVGDARKRFLVHDEIEEFPIHGFMVPYRIRIWRGENLVPIIIVSHLVDACLWPAPRTATARIANYINATMLGYSSPGMLNYFEDEWDYMAAEWRLFQVAFERVGQHHRLRLTKPERSQRPWALIDNLLRQKIVR